MAGVPYVRLSPQLDSDITLDETSDEVLVHMLWVTQVKERHECNVETRLI